jgi:putative transposase
MADDRRLALREVLRKAEPEQDADFLRDGVRGLNQALLELEVTQYVRAERHERTAERSGQRNGYRDRTWDTRVGSVELPVSRVRDGSSYPSLLQPRKRAERAVVAVIQEAYAQGGADPAVDDLVPALGPQGMKGQVSRLCGEPDTEVERLRGSSMDRTRVWLDATFVKVRDQGRAVSKALVLAIGDRTSGEREMPGLDAGPSEDGAFWLQFLRPPVTRGLLGVQLGISDAHQGLEGAIVAILQGRVGSAAGCTSSAICGPGAEAGAGDGRGHDPDRLRPAGSGEGGTAVAEGG